VQPSEASQPETKLVALARIQTTHGRRGEVAADLLTDFPERLGPGLEVLVGEGRRQRRLCIEDAWVHKSKHQERLILKFRGVDTLTEAATLAGSPVQLPQADRHPLPPGRLYISDLIGCAVLERDLVLGRVDGWDETGGVPLLRVAGQSGELLIPYTLEICYAVDTEKKQIRVRLPAGLKELNLPARREKECKGA
jgi:16S rRNA processing protein RimM